MCENEFVACMLFCPEITCLQRGEFVRNLPVGMHACMHRSAQYHPLVAVQRQRAGNLCCTRAGEGKSYSLEHAQLMCPSGYIHHRVPVEVGMYSRNLFMARFRKAKSPGRLTTHPSTEPHRQEAPGPCLGCLLDRAIGLASLPTPHTTPSICVSALVSLGGREFARFFLSGCCSGLLVVRTDTTSPTATPQQPNLPLHHSPLVSDHRRLRALSLVCECFVGAAGWGM